MEDTYVLTPKGRDLLDEIYHRLILSEVGKEVLPRSTKQRDYWRFIILNSLEEEPLQTERELVSMGPKVYMREAFNWARNRGYIVS